MQSRHLRRLCSNHCQLTVNTFPGGRRYIAGNRCDKPVTHRSRAEDPLNLYDYKRAAAGAATSPGEGTRGTIGIPMGLNLYELLPLLAHLLHQAGL